MFVIMDSQVIQGELKRLKEKFTLNTSIHLKKTATVLLFLGLFSLFAMLQLPHKT